MTSTINLGVAPFAGPTRHRQGLMAETTGKFQMKTSPKSSSKRVQRLLLVDDDASVRDSLSEVLVVEGYVVIPAQDGQEAVALAAAAPVDIVLLDLNMPRKNGWDTFEQLTREHPGLPIIIVTARPYQLFTAVAAGVGALLEKPIDIPILLRTIQRLLAEPVSTRLARLAGLETEFHYAGRPQVIPRPV